MLMTPFYNLVDTRYHFQDHTEQFENDQQRFSIDIEFFIYFY